MKAPAREKSPAITQTRLSHTGECNWSAIEEGFINTPEPITEPIIRAVAAPNPMVRVSKEVEDIIAVVRFCHS